MSAKNFDSNKFATTSTVVVDAAGVSIPTNLTFALKNACAETTLQQGMINYGTLLLFIVGILVMNVYQKRKEVEFDEDEQTAQDHSIRILNPPKMPSIQLNGGPISRTSLMLTQLSLPLLSIMIHSSEL
jgi:hypothetical protein